LLLLGKALISDVIRMILKPADFISGARGLGNHMARACIEAGAKSIIIFDANKDLGPAAARELHELTNCTVPVSFLLVDVRDHDSVATAVKDVVAMNGVPDVLINSAGIAE
jgi:NAD(P)-dependent dehydrogenase (short-subunit alcohol dehydrogenase family)